MDDAVARQYHYEGSLEYKSYQKKLNQARGLNLFHDESKELICVDQLIKDQFLHVSAPYLTYVQSRIQDNDALFQGWSKQMADLKKETIQVITAADNNYAVPVTIMLFSLLENLKKAQPIEITILTCDMASFARKRLFDLVKGFENATIRFLSVPGNHFDHLGTPVRLYLGGHLFPVCRAGSFARFYLKGAVYGCGYDCAQGHQFAVAN